MSEKTAHFGNEKNKISDKVRFLRETGVLFILKHFSTKHIVRFLESYYLLVILRNIWSQTVWRDWNGFRMLRRNVIITSPAASPLILFCKFYSQS